MHLEVSGFMGIVGFAMNEIPDTTDTTTAAPKPEWLRVHQVPAIFGIGKSKLYELLAEGAIKSVSLRKRGQMSGTRLISYDSLAEFIESQVDDVKAKNRKEAV